MLVYFQVPVAVEVFGSPSLLPKDPVQRKQQLETLMDQISGSFSFMQACIKKRICNNT